MDNVTPQLPLHVSFFVPGVPAPGGSKKGFYNPKLKRVLMTPASSKTKPWMAQVSAFAMAARPVDVDPTVTPILLWIEFRMPRPKSHYRTNGEVKANAPHFCTKKPDLTKLVRSTEDACTSILWHDDSQVAIENVSKVYCDPGEVPGALISVYLL